MSKLFDKILKENIAAVFPSLSKKLLGIEVASSEELKDKLQRTTEREADFLRKVITTNNEALIVHLEFQTNDDQQIIERMRVYHALISQRYQLPVKQYVVYWSQLWVKTLHFQCNTLVMRKNRVSSANLSNLPALRHGLAKEDFQSERKTPVLSVQGGLVGQKSFKNAHQT